MVFVAIIVLSIACVLISVAVSKSTPQKPAQKQRVANQQHIAEPPQSGPPPKQPAEVLSCPHTAPYTIVDVETTGLSPFTDKIIQISAIRFDLSGKVVDTFDTYVNPGVPIPPMASKVNHITDSMVSDAPRPEDVRDRLLDFLGDDLIVGYNTTFDLKFLNNTFSGAFDGREYVDALEIARASLSLPSYRLEAVARTAGHRSSAYHNSLVDCEAVAAVLLHIGEDMTNWTKTFFAQKPQERTSAHYYDREFEKGLKFYSAGEQSRLIGDFDKALQLFEKARASGYNAPAIYSSYAVLYRKQKEYQKEIDILDEGIKILSEEKSEDLRYRRIRAEQLLQAQKAKQAEDEFRAQKKTEREMRKQLEAEAKAMRQPQGTSRPIFQMTDDGVVTNRFESVSEASRVSGISEKCIRDAAKGRQKHAGGYCWQYENVAVSEN